MAQKILIRRGGVGNVQGGGTVAVTKGELLYASGSIANTNVGDIIFISNETGNNFLVPVGKLFTGTEAPTSFDSRFAGLPYYRTDNNTLYRIGDGTALNLSGNIINTTLTGMTVSGSFSGSFQGQFAGSINSASFAESASYAQNATSASVAISSSHAYFAVSSVSSSFANNANNAISASFATNAATAAFATSATSASYAQNATSASVAISATTAFSATSASFASTAATALTATSASFSQTARSASYANVATSASVAVSSSYAFAATSASIALVAGTATTASFALGGSGNFSGSFSGSFRGDGSQLTGIAADLNISGSSGTGTVALKTQSLIITGSNGISVSANGQTFGISIPSNLFVPQNLEVGGNLDVKGTVTYISSSQVDIGNNVIQLNSFGAAVDGGILVLDSSGSFLTGSLLWNSAADYWYGGVSGSTQYRFVTYDSQAPATNAITKIDSNKRLVASSLSDTGTAVSSSVALSLAGNKLTDADTIRFSGLSGSSFIHTNASKELTAIVPLEADTMLMWTGTVFTASRVIDGGLF
jgi:hypothetical protein